MENFRELYEQQFFSRQEIDEAVNSILENRFESGLKPEDFQDIYSPEEIAADQAKVNDIKKRQKAQLENLSDGDRERIERGKEKSQALEIIVADQVELNNWFGENVILVPTLEYDDRLNGTDAVAEFDLDQGKAPERAALAIDVTMKPDFPSSESKLEGKINRNIAKVTGQDEHKKYAPPVEVKYFQSEMEDFKGRLEAIVPLVIGLEGENADSLIVDFAKFLELKSKAKRTPEIKAQTRAKRADLENHPAQRVFLEEMKRQLEMYLRLLDRQELDKAHEVYQEKIQQVYKIVTDILAQKQGIALDRWESDHIFEQISAIAQKKEQEG